MHNTLKIRLAAHHRKVVCAKVLSSSCGTLGTFVNLPDVASRLLQMDSLFDERCNERDSFKEIIVTRALYGVLERHCRDDL